MSKRPAVMSLDDLMGSKPIPEPAPIAAVQPDLELASLPAPVKAEDPPLPTASPAAPGDKAFRTSIYFHRTVHDVLRDIAHLERKNISDLINEGLDHVLKKRGHPTTASLRKGIKA